MNYLLHRAQLEHIQGLKTHIHSNTYSPNSVTSYRPSIQTHESMGLYLFKPPQEPNSGPETFIANAVFSKPSPQLSNGNVYEKGTYSCLVQVTYWSLHLQTAWMTEFNFCFHISIKPQTSVGLFVFDGPLYAYYSKHIAINYPLRFGQLLTWFVGIYCILYFIK